MSLLKGETKKFTNDREYTYNSLIKQLNLLELHIRDGSFRECSCSPAKHLPTIEGLAEEAIGFTEDKTEKNFMQKITDAATQFKYALKSKEKITDEEADEIRAWAREMRRRIDLALWEGDLPKSSRKDEIKSNGNGNEIYGTIEDDTLKPKSKQRHSDWGYVRTSRSDEENDVRFVSVSPANARRDGLD